MEEQADKQEKRSFRILKDEANAEDLFEGKTHERVANSIAELICGNENEGGTTIGLEGSWGSGKSTVISLLRNKLEENKAIKIFHFDAWAHQGDPLRRIFLESLIDSIDPKNKTLAEKKEKIAKRHILKTVETKRTVTLFGRLISLSAFFVPVGLALMSVVDDVNFNFVGTPNWEFIVSLLLSGAPLVIVLFRVLWLLFTKRAKSEICAVKNWSFLEEDSEQNVKQEVSEEEERSSIEFERYFVEIVEELFKKQKDAKLLLIIDNLDRVNSEDALTIWSTLQTFLQQRNYASKEYWFKRIWVLVPYDPDGLSLLWDKENMNNEVKLANDENDEKLTAHSVAKAFFDKNFQLRFEISKPILSSWIDFLERMVNEAFGTWSNEDRKEIIEVLQLTNKDLIDNPTPREIKNYVNQVGLFASQYKDEEITIGSIAYYVVLRQIRWLKKDIIRRRLINGSIPEKEHRAFLPLSCVKDLSGLVFGVTPEKGSSLLLKPEIIKFLKNTDAEKLTILKDIHNNDFVNIIFHHITHDDIAVKEILIYANSLYKAFGENTPSMYEFVKRFKTLIIESDIIDDVDFSKTYVKESFLAAIKMCSANKETEFLSNLYGIILKSVHSFIEIEDGISEQITKLLYEIVSAINDVGVNIAKQEFNFKKVQHFYSWCVYAFKWNYELWNYIYPSSDLINGIAVPTSKKIIAGTLESVKYVINSNIEADWSNLLLQCKAHISHNSGTYDKNVHSPEVLEIITRIGFSSTELNEVIKDILTKGEYFNLLSHIKTESIVYAALICGYYFTSDLQETTIPVVVNSQDGLDLVKNYWSTSDEHNAEEVLDFLSQYNVYEFLWDLAEDKTNLLVADIISNAAKNENLQESFFNVEDGINKLKCFINLIGNDSEANIKEVAKSILQYGNIEKELLNDNELDLTKNTEELYYFLSQTSNQYLIQCISELIKKIEKEQWVEALEKKNELLSLVFELKYNDEEFSLLMSFYEALIEFSKSLTGDKTSEWQNDKWNILISLIHKDYIKSYKDQITEQFLDEKENVSKDFLRLNSQYFSEKKLLGSKDLIVDFIISMLQKNEYEKLAIILPIFSQDNIQKELDIDEKRKFLSDKINANYKETDEDSEKQLLEKLADLLDIEIQEENEDDATEDTEIEEDDDSAKEKDE